MPTLAVMRAEVIREGDLQDVVGNSDVDAVLNEELADLHDLLVLSFEDYATTSGTLTILAGQDSVALPATYFKARGVDDLKVPTAPRELPRFVWQQRNRVCEKSYAIHGANFLVRPTTVAPGSYRLHFAPLYVDLVVDGDTFVAPNNWHKLAVLQAAARFIDIQKLDSSALTARAERVRTRIEAAARQRDAGSPQQAADVRPRFSSRHLLPGEED